MLTVLCVRFGEKYGPEYVERLRNMVARNITIPYEFACLTDDQRSIKGVKTLHIGNQGYSKGWWHKVHMFDKSLGINDRILYFDLDVVIHNNIDKLVLGLGDSFYGIRDFNRKFNPKWKILNSSAMSWMGNKEHDIYDMFLRNKMAAMQLHGDQDWIYKVASDRIKFWPDQWLMSYKWEIRKRNEINFSNPKRTFYEIANPTIPNECSVAVFHGDPKPEDVQDPIVVDNWR
jgi:hypothetical protein